MRHDEYLTGHDDELSRSPSRFELFYYERVGTRYYLRLTKLAVILVFTLTLISMGAISVLFLTTRHSQNKQTPIKLKVPESTINYNYPVIEPLPPPAPKPTGRVNKNTQPRKDAPPRRRGTVRRRHQ